jgi:Mn2+/Fe2+ NRAMP family transporter
MGEFANSRATAALAWGLFGLISAANAWLVVQVL